MTEIRTNEFLVLGGKFYPAFGRPLGCKLEMVGETDLKPRVLTREMLLDPSFSFCVAECGKCSITLA